MNHDNDNNNDTHNNDDDNLTKGLGRHPLFQIRCTARSSWTGRRRRDLSRIFKIHQMGVQWEGGAVDGGSII